MRSCSRTTADQLVPKAVRWRDLADSDERMTISRTIIDYVLEQGQGVITTDAPSDKRFSPAQSIVDYHIREAICVPIQGRHTTLGVLYADIQSGAGVAMAAGAGKDAVRGKFSQDQLMLMVAIGHQAGLAIENTTFYNAKIQAERLAAVGQTIATLSHHIKNILQGIRGGILPHRPGAQREGREPSSAAAGRSSRRTRPRSTTWSWTCSRSRRIASPRSSPRT